MKKLLVLLLVLATVFCLASCEYLPEDFQSAIDSVKGKCEDLYKDAQSAVDSTIDSVKGKCEDLYKDAQSAVDSTIDKVKDVLGIESSCEHNWISATCTAPKTCSVCGATEGVAKGHTEVTVAGTAATCTESGMTDGKKCTVCGEIIVEQTVTSALGHTEETIAGTPATCTEAGITDGKKCTVCGVTTVEQTEIDALGHKPEADDGDVTTPVECANEGCNHIFVEAKDAITFTIPTFENGTVTADKKNYAIGDTVKLTINPEFDYAQKLYINDEPLILDWNTNVYSFVVEEDTYVISGSFEPAMNMAAGDETRWDYINQAHGIVTTYYPNNNDAWWFQINGEYESFSINAKNYRDVENSYENGPDGGWRIALYMKLDNGNYYAFTMWIDANHKYAYNHFGGKIAGDKDSVTTWGGAWHDLAVTNAEATAALNGDGAEFKLDRIDGNHIQVTFGGIVLETYEIPGVTAENKVVSVGLHHWGNKGAYVVIPFTVTTGCNHTWVDATCTAPKTCSECGMTMGGKLDHTYTNYVSNNDATCTADGTKTGTCVCGEKDTIADEGSALGHKEEIIAGKDATCTATGMTDGKKCTVCGETTLEQTEIPIKSHRDDDKNYVCDDCQANLCINHTEEIIAGIAATCTTTGLTEGKKCSACGGILVEQEIIPAKGHKAGEDDGDCTTAVKCINEGCGETLVAALTHNPVADDGDVTTAVKCANKGCEQILVPAKEAITLTIPTFEHGAVTADKMNYAIGDTVTLTIAPEGGYFQKLYINGEPLMLDWKIKTYSFVAEENTYVIDGSFEPTLEVYAGDWSRWDDNNQAHGILSAYYPKENDAWWFKIKGDYSSFAINAKNYRDIANSYEGGPDGGWRIALYMQLDNGNYYAFSMWIDASQKYAYNHFGGKIAGDKESVTTWGGAWRDLAVVNAEATAALNGNGAEFKLERIDGNHIQVTFGGIVLETYEIPGVTADNKVVSVGLHHWGNKGAHVEIPFELTKACAHTWVDATCTAPKTCSICKVTMGEKLEHTYTNYVSNNDATCTADGTKTGTCVCGEKDTIADEGSATNHPNKTTTTVDATCTVTGSETVTCDDCGETLSTNVIPAKDHTDDDKNYKCDVCGVNLCTDHVEEIVAGKDATCTENGITEGKKCSICGSVILAQKIIPAKGHKASEDDSDCTTAVKCSNAGCDYIFVEALSHNPAADDGDVTTAVKCTNEGCAEILVPAKEAITLTIPTFEHGAVTTDKMNYAVGDTVTLTVAPAKDYAQKLYINGNPILVNANSKYSFVAEEGKTYDITGEFVYVKGAWFWTAEYIVLNQAHGVFHSPVPTGGEKNGELVPTADKYCGGKVLFKDPSGGTKQDYAIVLKMIFSDGQKAEVRIVNKDGKGHYMVQSMSGMLGSWKWFYDLTDEENAAVASGEGVWFELVREGTDIKIKVNGSVKTRNDVTVNVPVDVVLNQFKITTYNFSYAIDVHYAFTKACAHTWVDATCTAPKTCSICKVTMGEKLEHTYTNYVSNNDATCTADGTKTGTCVCGEKNTIADEGSALDHKEEAVAGKDATCTEAGLTEGKKCSVCGEIILAQDVIPALGHVEETVAGKDATCTETGITEGKKCTVCGVITIEQTVIPEKGHKDDDKNFECDVCHADLCTDHVEEVVAGTDATCTASGLTEGKKCSICGKSIVEQTVIPALGHKEETVAGKDATCTEDGLTEGKKCSVCGITIVEQTVIPAKGHKAGEDDGDCTTAVKCINEGCGETLVAAKASHVAGEDDGDITTPVKCTNEGCQQDAIPAKEAITLTIPTFEHGAVTADKDIYAIGDTVTLTIAPEGGYFQKLYINGKALMLDWKTFTYSFVATEDAYEITGSFERGLNLAPSDWGRWDDHNQLHGVLNTYYPSNNDSWWMAIKGNYNSLSINVKNHLPIGETADNFYVYLRVTMENGNTYNFRIGTDKGGYTAYNRAGIQNPGDASADWSHWKNLSKLDSKITTEGVEFKVERQGANTLVLTVDGEVVDTYTMNGITADDKIASIDIKHQGNKGKYVETSFVLTNACNHTWVDATCTAPKTCSICKVTIGEKLDHTYTNYVSNNDATCTADGTKTGTCVCGEKNTIADEGSALYHKEEAVAGKDATCTTTGLTEGKKCSVCGEIILAQDVIPALGHKEEAVAGKDATCTEAGITEGKKCTVCGVITIEQTVIPAKGHKDDDKNFACDVCHADLCTNHVEEVVAGKDATCTASGLTEGKKCSICGKSIVEQTVIPALGHKEETVAGKDATCTEDGLTEGKKCSVCGITIVEQTVVPAKGHKAGEDDGDCTTAVKCINEGCGETLVAAKASHEAGEDDGDITTPVKCTNDGCQQDAIPAKEAITLTIPTFEHGAVTADKDIYAIGDTVTLTIAPAGGYFQKLYINGEPLLLEWKTKVYSFVAEKDTYVISGSFEPTLEVYAGDWGRWDNANQAHGLLSAYYPNNNDAWWYKIKGNYSSFSINAKNYRDIANSYEGGPDGGWRIALYMQLDNGNYYAFSMWIDAGQKYAYNHYGGKIAGEKDSVTTWGGAWRDLAVVNAEATAALNGNGAEFKIDRIDGNHIQVTFGGVVLETYEIPGVTANNKVVSVGLHHWGNKGAHVDIPFALTVPTVEEEPPVSEGDVTLNIGEFANGTVTADKGSYKVGETVTLTVAPAKDYAQKLYINGAPILVDTNSKYSFVVEEGKTYDITGEFVNVKGDWFWTAEYIVLNQAHGVFHSPIPAGGEKNGELVPTADKCYGGKVLVKDPSGGSKQDFAIVLKMTFSDGQKAELRLVNKDGKGHYMVQSMSGMFGSWKWYYDLNDEENAAVANGEGVWFELVRDGSNINIMLNGKVIPHRADTPISLAESTVLNQFKVTTYNFSYAMDVKYEFYMAE